MASGMCGFSWERGLRFWRNGRGLRWGQRALNSGGVEDEVAGWGTGDWCGGGRLVRAWRSGAWQMSAPRRPSGEAMVGF